MDSRTVEEIEGWDRGGFDGDLHALADREFSGAVRADGTYLFAVAGRPVGVVDYRADPGAEPTVEPSEVDRIEGADGETFAAPHDALPLLYAMKATGGETRGRYYTNKTPIEEVDETLREGGFTGYLELSENVLSGDYFLVYHGGERRSVAFIGQSRRLKSDEEAYDLMCDEVGIYEVRSVDLPRLELPEREESGGGAGAVGAAGAGAAAGAAGAGAATDDETDGGVDAVPNAGPDPTGEDEEGVADASAGGPTDADETGPGVETGADAGTTDGSDEAADDDVTAAVEEVDPADDLGGLATDPLGDGPDEDAGDADDTADEDESADSPAEGPADASAGDESVDSGEADGDPDAGGDVSEGAEATPEDVEAAAAAVESTSTDAETESESGSDDGTSADEGPDPEPSPDPGESATEVGGAAAGGAAAGAAASTVDPDHVVPSIDPDRSERESGAVPGGTEGASADPAAFGSGTGTGTDAESPADGIVDGETVAGLREELASAEREVAELETELAERDEELGEVRERLAAVESERDELRGRVSELESRLSAVGAATGGTERSLSPDEALSGTSLFVRYRSKRDPTLEDVYQTGADQSAVRDNLRLEHHTQFDADSVSVDGRQFGAFLTGTQEYAFVRWLVEEFPFEVRDTGNTGTMAALYDSLPSLDRLEFGGEIETDEGAKAFDVVGRDRMGQPLVVADLEDVREPTDEVTLAELVKGATAVVESHDGLAGAFAVTASYFEPAALETAREATSDSLLSRSKRKSFVKLSRNLGYHLCLVEDREESFYLSVPEL